MLLINCFGSALGVSFNIHQLMIEDSSELSLNIDGAEQIGGRAGTLPPARALSPPLIPHKTQGFQNLIQISRDPLTPLLWCMDKAWGKKAGCSEVLQQDRTSLCLW